MSVDERIEKLTERHEALAQSIELMILESRDWQREYREREKQRERENQERDQKWDRRFGQVVTSLEQLVHVAELHQHRLDSQDGRLDELEGAA